MNADEKKSSNIKWHRRTYFTRGNCFHAYSHFIYAMHISQISLRHMNKTIKRPRDRSSRNKYQQQFVHMYIVHIDRCAPN